MMKRDLDLLRRLIEEAIILEDQQKPTGKAQGALRQLGKDPIAKATSLIKTRTDAESVILGFIKDNLGSVAPGDVIRALSNVTNQLKKRAAQAKGDEVEWDE